MSTLTKEQVAELKAYYEVVPCNEPILKNLREVILTLFETINDREQKTVDLKSALAAEVEKWRIAADSTWPPEPEQLTGPDVYCDEARKAIKAFADAISRIIGPTKESDTLDISKIENCRENG